MANLTLALLSQSVEMGKQHRELTQKWKPSDATIALADGLQIHNLARNAAGRGEKWCQITRIPDDGIDLRIVEYMNEAALKDQWADLFRYLKEMVSDENIAATMAVEFAVSVETDSDGAFLKLKWD